MSNDLLEASAIAVDISAVAFQIVTVYLAYRLTRTTGGFRAWWLMIIAFTLQAARRLGVIALALGQISFAGLFQAIDPVMALAISGFMLVALYIINMTFERESKRRQSHKNS